MTVTQAESRTPNILELSFFDEERCSIKIHTYPTDTAGLGTMYVPFLKENDQYFLTSGCIGSFQTSIDETMSFLELEDVPVRTSSGSIRWSSSLSMDELRTELN
jgi:hypothetical protein